MLGASGSHQVQHQALSLQSTPTGDLLLSKVDIIRSLRRISLYLSQNKLLVISKVVPIIVEHLARSGCHSSRCRANHPLISLPNDPYLAAYAALRGLPTLGFIKISGIHDQVRCHHTHIVHFLSIAQQCRICSQIHCRFLIYVKPFIYEGERDCPRKYTLRSISNTPCCGD